MDIIGVIPARSGSKGIPNKNTKLLGERPLLEYSVRSALNSSLSRIILSTDSPSIAELGRKLGVEVPFIRPKHLASDQATSVSVLKHVIKFLSESEQNFDALCLLQPTTPFRSAGLIDKAIKKFKSSEFDSLVSVKAVPYEFHPYWTFVGNRKDATIKLAIEGKKLIPRRQNLPAAYYRDGSIYLIKSDTLLKNNSMIGSKLGYIINSSKYHVNLDTMEDWELAENTLKKVHNINNIF